MPQNLENNPPNWDKIDDECQHIPLPMDHNLWKRNSNSCYYMFEMDLQL